MQHLRAMQFDHILSVSGSASTPCWAGRQRGLDSTVWTHPQCLFFQICPSACLGRAHSGFNIIHLSARETLPLSKPGPEGTVYTVTLWVKREVSSHTLALARGRVVKLFTKLDPLFSRLCTEGFCACGKIPLTALFAQPPVNRDLPWSGLELELNPKEAIGSAPSLGNSKSEPLRLCRCSRAVSKTDCIFQRMQRISSQTIICLCRHLDLCCVFLHQKTPHKNKYASSPWLSLSMHNRRSLGCRLHRRLGCKAEAFGR